MKNIYRHVETVFEKLVFIATAILGNSITFIIALCLVIFWLATQPLFTQNIHDTVRDIIHGIIFLSLFIIQKSFNRFSASLHLKVNELVSSHEPASNTVINTEIKTERELTELSKEYAEPAEEVKEKEDDSAKPLNV